MADQPINLAVSVHQRLLNLSRQRRQDFNQLLTYFALERFLYRLSQSSYESRFILKGALLFLIWDVPFQRPTRDLDLLGFGESTPDKLLTIFREICQLPVSADGLAFDPDRVRIIELRADQEYQGQRVDLVAQLGQARIPVRIDIGFGDRLSQTPLQTDFPTLLDFPQPVLRTYPKESVIAEKAHAMVALDLTNSRMKDFFDIWTLARYFSFDGATLAQAMAATFTRRHTTIPSTTPTALTPAFAEHPDKSTQWRAFLNRTQLDVDGRSFEQVIAELASFLLPPLQAISRNEPFNGTWSPQGPWAAES